MPVYDYGEDAGQPFIVMRLMQGGSLADRLQAGRLALGRGGNWEVKITVNGVVALRESIFVEGQWDLWTPPGTIDQCG